MPRLNTYEIDYTTGQKKIAATIVTAKTSDYAVTQAETGTVFTNTGASGLVVFTLPTATASLEYTFCGTANQPVTVKTDSGDDIKFSIRGNEGTARGTTLAIASEGISDGGDINNVNIGASVTMVAVDATSWIVENIDDGWNVGVGYSSGGYAGGTFTVTDGLTFSTDTTTQTTRGVLSIGRYAIGGANSTTTGYSMGGYTGAPSALTEGLLFSSDTTAQVTKGSLSQARTTMQSCNSVTTAYTMGGSTDSSGLPAGAQSTTDGLTFSTDTTTQTTRGVLVTAKLASGSFNSLITGYASGGVDTSSVLLAETCGLTFVTDTTAQVTKGALTGNFARLSGFNSSLFGYSHAGSTSSFLVPVESAVVNSLTFSSDTTAQVTKGSLSQA